MSDPVQNTIDRTQERLSTGWTDWAVTPGDLRNIAADLDALTPSQRQEVIEGLSDDDLQKLAGEIMQTRPLIGGLSSGERQELFTDLARGLDGTQLARVAEAFATTGGDSDGFTPIGELAAAVATHSGTQQKLDFIAELAPLTTDSTSFSSTGIGYSNSTYADAQANAVGTVIASMRGQAVTQALNILDDAQLQAVIDTSVQANMSTASASGGIAASMSWDTSGYEGIMEAVATARTVGGSSPIDSVEQRARVFDAAGNALAEIDDTSTIIGGLTVIGKSDTMAAVTQGMTEVLESDTTGIVSELAYDQRFDEGNAMTAYSKAMLQSGQEQELGEIMGRLQFGNNLNENPIARLEAQVDVGNGGTINANAGTLGYFVGSVHAATRQVSSDIAEQQALVSDVLGAALGFIDFGAVGPAVDFASKQLITASVEAAINDTGSAPAERLEDAAIPADPETNNRAISDAANSAFDDSISKVIRNN
ncbi:MAG: hypothetical protein AAF707_00390 [Pseudomonadota bacterium]